MNIAERFKYIFEPDLIAELEVKGKYLKLSAGETLMEVGQTVRIMPIILSGTIKVSRIDEEGKELFLYYVNPNESCAMSFTCCMQHRPSEIKAEADDEVEIIALPVSVMDEWLMKYATWKNFVMKTIQDRFNELLKAIDQIAFQKLDERLVHYLKEKSKVTGSAVINLSHEQIANELATSRVVVSRLLKKLENDKKLVLYRNQIKIFKDL
jgi:CRP/FNR family transcriptional regulator